MRATGCSTHLSGWQDGTVRCCTGRPQYEQAAGEGGLNGEPRVGVVVPLVYGDDGVGVEEKVAGAADSGGGHGLVGERFQGNARDGRQVTRWGRNSGQSSLRQPSVTGLSRPRQSRWTARLQSQHQMPPMTWVSSSHSTTKTARAVPQPQHISRNWVGVRVVDQQWAGVGCRHDDRRHASRATWLGVKAVKSLRPRR